MKTIYGIGASDGYAIEKTHFSDPLDLTVRVLSNQNPETEMKRFIDAQNTASDELSILYEKTKIKDEETAKVFEIHQMFVTDLDFTEGVQAEIENGKNAEYAVDIVSQRFKSFFEAMDDEVMKARAADVSDIRNRLIRILNGIEEKTEVPEGRFILLSEEILPSDIVKFDTKSIAGFVMKYGSKTSHAAILARTLNLPIIIGVEDFELIPHQGILAINGKTGEIIIAPDQKTVTEYQRNISKEEEFRKSLEQYRGKTAITKRNHKVTVACNIGNLYDIDSVIVNDADAVGLFRSEFIYMESSDYPSEEKQFQIYKEILSRLAPRNVIIRTLDIGADKVAKYFKLDKEDNPALGYRAIRICLNEQKVFATQLKALFRASIFGNLSIMFPMITHTEQVKETLDLANAIKADLKKAKIPYDEKVQIGIMIETPASVMISDQLAKMVDFFSIGTNDLTQYTLAVDRMNRKIQKLFNPAHDSIKKMIAIVAENAHNAGIWVGICGESAGDIRLLDFYLEQKIDELSVSPGKVLQLKQEILKR